MKSKKRGDYPYIPGGGDKDLAPVQPAKPLSKKLEPTAKDVNPNVRK